MRTLSFDARRSRFDVYLILAALAIGSSASAEPAFLSKQYTRCTSCHVSPTGGGLLSSYGRALSSHLLSTTGRTTTGDAGATTPPREASFLWGALGNALGPVQLGIDFRPSRLETMVSDHSRNLNFIMNADLIGAVSGRGWTAYGEFGREPTNPGSKVHSYEHWIGYASSSGLGFRAGRFLPAYGVKFSDHTGYNRAYLGFEKYDQVYGLEVSHSSSRTLTQVTLAPGLADSFGDDARPRAFTAAARLQIDLGTSAVMVGSGLYRAESDRTPSERAAGAALGFAPTGHLTVWTQADAHAVSGADETTWIVVNETSIEPARGLWVKVSPQFRSATGVQPDLKRLALTGQWLPRTHFDANITYYRDRVGSITTIKTWLLQFHLYL